MSIIQTIRDRAAILVFGVIAISLIGFLVQDAFVGKTSSLFRGNAKTVGSVNGKDIEREEYDLRARMAETQYQEQGYTVNESIRGEIYNQIWNGFVTKELLQSETDRLGLEFTPKELGELLFSDRAPQEFRRQFTDPQTGVYNVEEAKNAFRNLQRSKNTAQVKQVNEQLLDPISLNALSQKFLTIFKQGIYYPKWLVEKQNTENSLISKISYAGINYATIPDSSVKVTDDEINQYINAHKEHFKQTRSKSLAYVAFSDAPSAQDSTALWKKLEDLKAPFAQATDVNAFLTRNGSKIPFYDSYLGKTRIQVSVKDTLFKLAPGQVFGPYLDAGSYVIAKVIAIRNLPDSVKARHILIATVNPQTGQPILEDSVGKKRIDSIELAIKNGAPFDSLALKYSDDKSSAIKGGELGYYSQGTMVKPFNDFTFEKNKGDKGVIKSDFGYHYIEIEDQKAFEPAYKIAYMSRPIETSDETDRAAQAAANQFSVNSRDQKSFDDNVSKQKLNKLFADNIPEMAFQIAGLGTSRQLIKWAYDNKTGAVSDPYLVGDKYVVAIVTGEKEEGTQSAASARAVVEPILIRKKKAEQIVQKYGTYNTIEEFASKSGQQVSVADTVRFVDNFIQKLGAESMVIGASFNKNYQSKVSPILEGAMGAYVVKVENIGAVPNADANIDQQKKNMETQFSQGLEQAILGALRDAAKIEDKRISAGY